MGLEKDQNTKLIMHEIKLIKERLHVLEGAKNTFREEYENLNERLAILEKAGEP